MEIEIKKTDSKKKIKREETGYLGQIDKLTNIVSYFMYLSFFSPFGHTNHTTTGSSISNVLFFGQVFFLDIVLLSVIRIEKNLKMILIYKPLGNML